jgi:hypothetical protein
MSEKVSLGGFKVSEDRYKADLALMDRCQGYSGELIRLALLGVAGLGFMFVQLATSQRDIGPFKDPVAGYVFCLATIFFLLSTGFGLLHRYYCWDAFWSHVRSIRCSEAGPSRREDGLKSDRWRNTTLKRSSKCLRVAAICLWLGGIAFVVGLWVSVFNWIGSV